MAQRDLIRAVLGLMCCDEGSYLGGTAMEAEYFLQESEGLSQGQHEAVMC